MGVDSMMELQRSLTVTRNFVEVTGVLYWVAFPFFKLLSIHCPSQIPSLVQLELDEVTVSVAWLVVSLNALRKLRGIHSSGLSLLNVNSEYLHFPKTGMTNYFTVLLTTKAIPRCCSTTSQNYASLRHRSRNVPRTILYLTQMESTELVDRVVQGDRGPEYKISRGLRAARILQGSCGAEAKGEFGAPASSVVVGICTGRSYKGVANHCIGYGAGKEEITINEVCWRLGCIMAHAVNMLL